MSTTTEAARSRDEGEIAALIENRRNGHREKDAAAITAPYAPAAVRYDLAPPLVHHGMRRQEVEEWLATWDGPVTIDTRELDISVDGDLAVGWGLTRMRGRQGEVDQDLWFRMTLVLKRVGGQWRIVHEHTSVPFHMDGSYRAAIDLEPEERGA